jgi:hypothetical protein
MNDVHDARDGTTLDIGTLLGRFAKELDDLCIEIRNIEQEILEVFSEGHDFEKLMIGLQSLDGAIQTLDNLAGVAELMEKDFNKIQMAIDSRRYSEIVTLGTLRGRLLEGDLTECASSDDESGRFSFLRDTV